MRRAAALASALATFSLRDGPSTSRADASASTARPRDAEALLRAHVIFRHGERTPLALASTVDHSAWSSRVASTANASWTRAGRGREDVGKGAAGALTTRGAASAATLGEELIRERLIEREGLLSSDFTVAMRNGEVRARATGASRCVATCAMVVLGGWADAADGSDVLEIEVREKERETMFPKPGNACEALNDFFDSRRASEAAEDEEIFSRRGFEAVAAFRDALTGGRPEGRPAGLSHVWDPLQCMVSHDMPLPRGVTVEHVRELTRLMERRYFDAFRASEAHGNLIGTSLLREIADELVPESDSAYKLALYAGHDSTIISLFAALGEPAFASLREWPRVTSALVFETWRMRDGSVGVRAVYNGEPILLTSGSRKSDGLTPYDEFMSFVKSREPPTGFAATCASPRSKL